MTATTKVKLTQQLVYLEQHLLFGIFIDLKNAYDAMDREQCLDLLEAYGVGPKLLWLLQHFWDEAGIVYRAGGCYDKPFKACQRVTQGAPVSPRVFNLMVDAIVREWIRQVVVNDAARWGVEEEIRNFLAIFYAKYGLIPARCPERLQTSFTLHSY